MTTVELLKAPSTFQETLKRENMIAGVWYSGEGKTQAAVSLEHGFIRDFKRLQGILEDYGIYFRSGPPFYFSDCPDKLSLYKYLIGYKE